MEIDPAILDAVVGQYEVQPGDYVFLRVDDGRLVGSGEGTYWDDVMASPRPSFSSTETPTPSPSVGTLMAP